MNKPEIAKAIAEFYEARPCINCDTEEGAHNLLIELDKNALFESLFPQDSQLVKDANRYRKSAGICTVCRSEIGTGEGCESCIQYNADQKIERDIDKRREESI